MMPSVTVKRKDGTTQRFEEVGRAGGSWSMTLTFEGQFAVVTDEWGKRTATPAADIEEITQDAGRSSW
jgi:hypothetical protein